MSKIYDCVTFFQENLLMKLRFSILKKNGLIFQSQVSFLIPIFGIILGYIFLKELITPKIIVSVILVLIGIFLAKKSKVFQFFDGLSFSRYYNFVGFIFFRQITSGNRVKPNKPARSAQKWTKGDPLFSSLLSTDNYLQDPI